MSPELSPAQPPRLHILSITKQTLKRLLTSLLSSSSSSRRSIPRNIRLLALFVIDRLFGDIRLLALLVVRRLLLHHPVSTDSVLQPPPPRQAPQRQQRRDAADRCHDLHRQNKSFIRTASVRSRLGPEQGRETVVCETADRRGQIRLTFGPERKDKSQKKKKNIYKTDRWCEELGGFLDISPSSNGADDFGWNAVRRRVRLIYTAPSNIRQIHNRQAL